MLQVRTSMSIWRISLTDISIIAVRIHCSVAILHWWIAGDHRNAGHPALHRPEDQHDGQLRGRLRQDWHGLRNTIRPVGSASKFCLWARLRESLHLFKHNVYVVCVNITSFILTRVISTFCHSATGYQEGAPDCQVPRWYQKNVQTSGVWKLHPWRQGIPFG